MFADSSKAARELDFRAGAVRDALDRAVRWYRERGYLASSRSSPQRASRRGLCGAWRPMACASSKAVSLLPNIRR
jgi:hypothetical protein